MSKMVQVLKPVFDLDKAIAFFVWIAVKDPFFVSGNNSFQKRIGFIPGQQRRINGHSLI